MGWYLDNPKAASAIAKIEGIRTHLLKIESALKCEYDSNMASVSEKVKKAAQQGQHFAIELMNEFRTMQQEAPLPPKKETAAQSSNNSDIPF